MKKMFIKRLPAVVGIAALGIFVFSAAVMLLWNNVLIPVLHIGAVTFWQAAGILLLTRILFGGFKGRGWHRGGGWKRQIMFERWQQMTPDEQEKLRNRFGGHCGRFKTAMNE